MLVAYTSRSLSAASMNTMRMLSMDMTLDYVIDAGGSFVWPPATRLELRVKLPSIFMSKII